MSQSGWRAEARAAYSFVIEIEGATCARFRSCSGLKWENEVTSLREGGQGGFEHRLMGGTKYGTLVLKQGFSGAPFYRRFLLAQRRPRRFHGAIVQLGPDGKPVARWSFKEAWISKWEGPDLDATKNEISLETIEIVHHGFEVEEVRSKAQERRAALGKPAPKKEEHFDQGFQLRYEDTGEPVANRAYKMTTSSGAVVRGRTDAAGRTVRVNSDSPETVTIEIDPEE